MSENINELEARFPESSMHRLVRLPHPGAPPPATVEGWVTPDTKPVDGWFRDPIWASRRRLNYYKDGVNVGCVRQEESGAWCGAQWREEWLVHRSPLSGVSLEDAMKHVEAYEVKPFVDMTQAWLDATAQLREYPSIIEHDRQLWVLRDGVDGWENAHPTGWFHVSTRTATGNHPCMLVRYIDNMFAGRVVFGTHPGIGWYLDMEGPAEPSHWPSERRLYGVPSPQRLEGLRVEGACFTTLQEAISKAEEAYASMPEDARLAMHAATLPGLPCDIEEEIRRKNLSDPTPIALTVVPSEDPYEVDFDPTYFQVDDGSLAGRTSLVPPVPPHPSADSFPASAEALSEDDDVAELDRLIAKTGAEIEAMIAQYPRIEAPPGDPRNAPSTAESPWVPPTSANETALRELFPSLKHDHPAHYGGKNNPYEAIKVIEAWGLDFLLGNLVKYVSRAGKKAGETKLDDLRKARWYLDRAISNLETPNPKETP